MSENPKRPIATSSTALGVDEDDMDAIVFRLSESLLLAAFTMAVEAMKEAGVDEDRHIPLSLSVVATAFNEAMSKLWARFFFHDRWAEAAELLLQRTFSHATDSTEPCQLVLNKLCQEWNIDKDELFDQWRSVRKYVEAHGDDDPIDQEVKNKVGKFLRAMGVETDEGAEDDEEPNPTIH